MSLTESNKHKVKSLKIKGHKNSGKNIQRLNKFRVQWNWKFSREETVKIMVEGFSDSEEAVLKDASQLDGGSSFAEPTPEGNSWKEKKNCNRLQDRAAFTKFLRHKMQTQIYLFSFFQFITCTCRAGNSIDAFKDTTEASTASNHHF